MMATSEGLNSAASTTMGAAPGVLPRLAGGGLGCYAGDGVRGLPEGSAD